MREFSPPSMCHMSPVSCHVLHVKYHVSHVMCHMSNFIFGESIKASGWKVCYQQGQPRLVLNWIEWLQKEDTPKPVSIAF